MNDQTRRSGGDRKVRGLVAAGIGLDLHRPRRSGARHAWQRHPGSARSRTRDARAHDRREPHRQQQVGCPPQDEGLDGPRHTGDQDRARRAHRLAQPPRPRARDGESKLAPVDLRGRHDVSGDGVRRGRQLRRPRRRDRAHRTGLAVHRDRSLGDVLRARNAGSAVQARRARAGEWVLVRQARDRRAERPVGPRRLRLRSVPDRVELIGRDRELDELRRALEKAQRGRGGLVLVGGEAGIGKTALVRAALERSGMRVHLVEAAKEANEPYAPLVSLLRGCLRADPTAADDLGSVAAPLALLLPELGPAAPETNQAAIVDALGASFAGMGARRPLPSSSTICNGRTRRPWTHCLGSRTSSSRSRSLSSLHSEATR